MGEPGLKYYSLGEVALRNEKLKLTAIEEGRNPLIQFSKEFIDNIENINQVDLAHAVPYIRLELLDLNGGVLKDYTRDIFMAYPDLSKPFPKDVRYPNRPLASLIGVEIKKDLGSGTGYIYFSQVKMNMRIHKIDALQNSPLKAFIFTGLPFKLTYGWNSPKNAFLNQKESLIFNVQTYDIAFMESNEIDFTIHGTGYRTDFLNVALGDEGNPIQDETKSNQSRGVDEDVKIINSFLNYVMSDATSILDIKKKFAQPTKDRRSRLQPFKARFEQKIKEFSSDSSYIEKTQTFTKKKVDCVYLHTLIEKFLEPSLKAIGAKMGGISEVRIIYGQFGESCGNYAGASTADFLIPKKEFLKKLEEEVKVKHVLTAGDFIDILTNHFLKEETYYVAKLDKEKRKSFSMPDIMWQVDVSFDSIKEDAKSYLNIYLFDSGVNVPDIFDINKNLGETASQDKIEQDVRSKSIPVIKYGHTNSYMSNLRLGTNMDPAMRSIYMSRIYNKVIGNPRDTELKDDQYKEVDSTPITLPLQGSVTVVGSTEWKPYKAVFLSNGVYLFDNIYKITSVTHRIDDKGFDTDLEFVP